MAVKNDSAHRADLEKRWKEICLDVIAEYSLVARKANVDESVITVGTLESGDSLNFEMFGGTPGISVRKPKDGQVRVLVGVIDGRPDGLQNEDRVMDAIMRKEIGGDLRYEFLERIVGGWPDIRDRLERNMTETKKRVFPTSILEDLVYHDLLLDDRSLDRATFYCATSYLSGRDLFDLKERISEKVKAGVYGPKEYDWSKVGKKAQEKVAKAEKVLEHVFRDWTRLAGRLDWRLVSLAEMKGEVTLKDLVRTADFAMKDPAFAAYRTKELPVWVQKQCENFALNYSKVPDRLKPALAARKQEGQVKI